MEYLSFSTHAADRFERSAQWRQMTRAPQVELGDDREASIRGCDLGPVRLCAVAIGTHRLDSDHEERSATADSLVKFLFIEEGACQVEQDGGSVLLHAGHWSVIDKSRPFRIIATAPTRQLALALPRRCIDGWTEESLARIKARSFLQGAAAVLHGSAAAAVDAATTIGRRDRVRLGEALAHLVSVVWSADAVEAGTGSQTARRRAVLDFIERHLSERDLDVGRIARELGYSRRTLHKLFADQAVTLSRMIWHKRLERCRQALLDPAQARRSITEIAHERGFSDSQHFSRSFKALYGVSPRDFRNTHLLH